MLRCVDLQSADEIINSVTRQKLNDIDVVEHIVKHNRNTTNKKQSSLIACMKS